jgi:hypothetical protein
MTFDLFQMTDLMRMDQIQRKPADVSGFLGFEIQVPPPVDSVIVCGGGGLVVGLRDPGSLPAGIVHVDHLHRCRLFVDQAFSVLPVPQIGVVDVSFESLSAGSGVASRRDALWISDLVHPKYYTEITGAFPLRVRQ